MKPVKLRDLSKKDYRRIIKRGTVDYQSIVPDVRKVMRNVRDSGDKVILQKYQKRYGKNNYSSIKVTKEEIKQAYKKVDEKLTFSQEQMIKNITAVHKAQLPRKKDTIIRPEAGVSVWRVWRPIEKVGLYIPGGKAIYPSSVLMSAIPAKIADCSRIIMCSPPREDGQIPAPVLVAADLVGLTEIYKVGGIEAIAAMTYGTETISKVYKIFGAGNSYVTAAKMLAFGEINIDMPAGPSEVFIVADSSADPAFIAADLLADGEHGEDSACVLITTSQKIAQRTVEELKKQLKQLPTAERAKESLRRYGLIGLVETMDEAMEFCNDYAPEHLTIMTRNPEALVDKIKNAGSVFLGKWTSKSSGDYATGANHVLPTGGMAKMFSSLGVDSFGKWMQVQKCTREGLLQIKEIVETLSDVEQLPAHRVSTTIRFEDKRW